jgi:hypothetical protein
MFLFRDAAPSFGAALRLPKKASFNGSPLTAAAHVLLQLQNLNGSLCQGYTI